jgi:hypothetical protein
MFSILSLGVQSKEHLRNTRVIVTVLSGTSWLFRCMLIFACMFVCVCGLSTSCSFIDKELNVLSGLINTVTSRR